MALIIAVLDNLTLLYLNLTTWLVMEFLFNNRQVQIQQLSKMNTLFEIHHKTDKLSQSNALS